MLSRRVLVIPVASLSSLSHPCHPRHPHHIPIIPVTSPLCPQLLVGLGVGGMSSSVHAPSTPRAAAREAGGT
jgi:hypothetical protein